MQKNKIKKQIKAEKKLDNYAWSSFAYLGSGPYGQLYKGIDIRTHSPVAIKILPLCELPSISNLIILNEEIIKLKQIKNPYLAKIFDIFLNKKNLYVIQEYCPGEDLRKCLDRNQGFLSETLILRVFQQLILGIQSLQALDFYNCNLKPENIMISSEKNSKGVKIVDFWLPKIIHCLKLSTNYGFQRYNSPQLLQNIPFTNKCEIWSLGLMLYEAVCRKLPWNGSNLKDFHDDIKTQTLKFPYRINVSHELKILLRSSLEYEEADRLSLKEVMKYQKVLTKILEKESRFTSFDEKTILILLNLQNLIRQQNIQIDTLFDKRIRDTNPENNNFEEDKLNILEFSEKFEKTHNKDDNNIGDIKAIKTNKNYKLTLQEINNNDPNTPKINNSNTAIMKPEVPNNNLSRPNIINASKLNSSFLKKKIEMNNNTSIEYPAKIILAESNLSNNIKLKPDPTNLLFFDDFSLIVKILDTHMSFKELQFFYEKLDPNNQGISFFDLKTLLSDSDFSSSEDYIDPFLEDKAERVTSVIREKILRNKIEITEIFKSFGISKDGSLELDEFEQLLIRINPRITRIESQYLFERLDFDHSGDIDINEFQAYILRDSSMEEKYRRLEDKYKEIKKTFKTLVLNQRVKSEKVFEKFSEGRPPLIKFEQLEKLLKVLDQEINKEEINYIFQRIDVGNMGFLDQSKFASSF